MGPLGGVECIAPYMFVSFGLTACICPLGVGLCIVTADPAADDPTRRGDGRTRDRKPHSPVQSPRDALRKYKTLSAILSPPDVNEPPSRLHADSSAVSTLVKYRSWSPSRAELLQPLHRTDTL